jgi:hypothetical protein
MILLNHLHGLRVGDVASDDQNLPYQTGSKILKGRDRFCRGHPRAAEIQKHGVKVLLLDHCQSLAGIGDNVAFASQSRQQNAEDVADGGFILDDENGAKVVTFVQRILDQTGKKQPILAQNPPGAFPQRAGSMPINALINLAVKSIKVRLQFRRGS